MSTNKLRLISAIIATFAGAFISFVVFKDIPFPLPIRLFFVGVAALIGFISPRENLDSISSEEAGNNQHGSARWASDKEKKEMFSFIRKRKAKKPGFIVGIKGSKYIIDTSDQNLNLVAPPGSGKTKRVIIPTIHYNGIVNKNTKGNGASLLLTDNKGELYNSTSQGLRNNGYKTACLDFANPLSSLKYNLLCNVNRYIDIYKSTENAAQKIIAYGKAERYAKILAESVVDSNPGDLTKSQASQYFTDTAKGLITCLSLLVSEYGKEGQRHIISVFNLMIELNGLIQGSDDIVQKSRLEELLNYIDNKRLTYYAGAAMKADVRTSMNIFSSGLGSLVNFIDAELEQMICSHSNDIGYNSFLENPTAIYIICPDENVTRHFFASLFIRYITNDLIEESRKYPNQELPRKILYLWDEFGNMPAIKDIDTIFSAARSRGIRILIALQSYAQLEKNYNKQMAQIILDSTQITMFTYVSPNSEETAERFSKMLGSQTIKTGSINYSSQSNSFGGSSGVTYNLMGRNLLMPNEIMTLPAGTFIIVKAGKHPVKLTLPFWWEYINKKKLPVSSLPSDENAVITSICCLTSEYLMQLSKTNKLVWRGMYD